MFRFLITFLYWSHYFGFLCCLHICLPEKVTFRSFVSWFTDPHAWMFTPQLQFHRTRAKQRSRMTVAVEVCAGHFSAGTGLTSSCSQLGNRSLWSESKVLLLLWRCVQSCCPAAATETEAAPPAGCSMAPYCCCCGGGGGTHSTCVTSQSAAFLLLLRWRRAHALYARCAISDAVRHFAIRSWPSSSCGYFWSSQLSFFLKYKMSHTSPNIPKKATRSPWAWKPNTNEFWDIALTIFRRMCVSVWAELAPHSHTQSW